MLTTVALVLLNLIATPRSDEPAAAPQVTMESTTPVLFVPMPRPSTVPCAIQTALHEDAAR